jgi:hypothetical protein
VEKVEFTCNEDLEGFRIAEILRGASFCVEPARASPWSPSDANGSSPSRNGG